METVVDAGIHVHGERTLVGLQVLLVLGPGGVDTLVQLRELNQQGRLDVLPDLLRRGGAVVGRTGVHQVGQCGRQHIGDVATETETDTTTGSDTEDPWAELMSAPANLPEVSAFDNDGETISSAVNQFGLNIFAQLDSEEDGNIFISPMSISTALAMAWNGSVSSVEEEMRSVLEFGEMTSDTIRAGYQNLVGGLLGMNGECTLEVANALWYRHDIKPKLNDVYIEEATDYFGVAVNELHGDPLLATDQVNGWVSDQTHGLIPELVPPEEPFSGDTAVVLANAIYFKGEWKTVFDSELTGEADFITAGSTTVDTTMMRRPDAYLPYYEDDGVQMVRMGYVGEDFAMTAVLPKSDTSVDDVLETLDAAKWQEWQAQMTAREGAIAFPKFTMGYKKRLNSALIALGMPSAFQFSSGFDRMVSNHPLEISRVLHQTTLEVNEKGTEASGVTIVEYMDSAPMDPFSIAFNHPFLVFIHDTRTNTILFMGRVENPTM